MAYYIGLDLGGTNIKSCVIDDHGQIKAEQSVPTEAQKGPEVVCGHLIESARRVAEAADLPLEQIDAIGIGAPGPLDPKTGVVINAPNLPDFHHVPVSRRITDATGRPSFLGNDANAAAFGEFTYGAGRDEEITSLCMLTLGTGVGGGIIDDGHLVVGAFGMGAELGHTVIEPNGRPCGCGQRGCLEQYASASAVIKQAMEAVRQGEDTLLQKVTDFNEGEITAKDVFDAARDGDGVARRLVDELCFYLGLGCVNLCRIIDPQMIVFAGGVILSGEMLFDGVRRHFREQNWKLAPTPVEIVPATLGNKAGRIGAAAIARDAIRNQ